MSYEELNPVFVDKLVGELSGMGGSWCVFALDAHGFKK